MLDGRKNEFKWKQRNAETSKATSESVATACKEKLNEQKKIEKFSRAFFFVCSIENS